MSAYEELSEALRGMTADTAGVAIDGATLGRVETGEITIHLGHLVLDDIDVAFRLDRIASASRTATGVRFVHHRADGRDETVEIAGIA